MSENETITVNAQMTIRRLDLSDADREALARLAERDSSRELQAPVIGIEVEGRLLAALSLATGEAIADPFSRTDELQKLLELRASHLRRRQHGGRRRLSLRRRGQAEPALATGAGAGIARSVGL